MFLGLVMAACLYTTKKPVGFNSYSHCNALVFLDLAKYSPRFLLIFLIRYQSFLPFCNYNKGVDIQELKITKSYLDRRSTGSCLMMPILSDDSISGFVLS